VSINNQLVSRFVGVGQNNCCEQRTFASDNGLGWLTLTKKKRIEFIGGNVQRGRAKGFKGHLSRDAFYDFGAKVSNESQIHLRYGNQHQKISELK
jgi:hypothetical protein